MCGRWRGEDADLIKLLNYGTYNPSPVDSGGGFFAFWGQQAMADTAKETKAQRVERLKRSRNPWEGLEEIRRFAREGFGSIPPEGVGTYLRWRGVYTQGDGAGGLGGKGGEGKALPYFMVRIRIPNGQLHSHQLRTIAKVTDRYARGRADITVRQN